VALAQYGIRYAVACLGTAVTPEHIEQLFRASDEIVFCFDGDRAGRDAAWRGLEIALPHMRDNRRLRFMFMPDGEDPDTLVRQIGTEAFEQQLTDAQALDEFLIEQFKLQGDFKRVDGQARLVEQSRPLLAKLPDGVYRLKLLERLAPLANIAPERLAQMLGLTGSNSPAAPVRRQSPPRPGAGKQQPSQLRHAISLLLQHPQLAATAGDPQRLAALQQPGIALLIELLELLQASPHLSTAALLEHWRGREEERHLFTLAQRELLLNAEQDDLEKEFLGAVSALEQLILRQRQQELSQKPFGELTATERLEYQALLQKLR
jgi:DNA primase